MSRHLLTLYTEDDRKRACGHCGNIFTKRPGYSAKYWARQKYCGQNCAGLANSARLAAKRLPEAEDFARWVDKSGECWLWTGALDKDGYGIFSYRAKSYRAAKIALKLDGRAVPAGLYACHHCDNPRCVRPSHLYPGTPAQNVADMLARQRNTIGARSHLTPYDILAIRSANGTHDAIAEQFGVSRPAISMIRSRRTWKHV